MSRTPGSTGQTILPWQLCSVLGLLSLLGLLAGSAVGSEGLTPLWALWQDPLSRQIVWDIRLPRSVGAWVGGSLLGLAGALAQGLFRNPLADPYLLGSASGASLGVALGLVLLGHHMAPGVWLHLGLTGMAFVGAVLAVVLTLVLAHGVQHSLRLLLAGVVVGVVLGAVSSLITLLRPEVLQGMQGFVLGSTAFVSWPSCGLMLAALMLCAALAVWLSPLLDALSLGESTALSLGLPLGPMRGVLVGVLSLATATAVAQLGLIAFVGLAAPHVVRAITHSTQRWVGVLSAGMGGVLLLWADVLARTVLAPQELPVGLLTAVLGGVYLLWLMHRSQGQTQVHRHGHGGTP